MMTRQRDRYNLIGIVTAVVLVLLDQWTKYLAVLHLKGQSAIVLWEGVFELHYLENRGAAFGILQGQKGVFLVCTVLILFLIAFFYIRMPEGKRFFLMRTVAVLLAAGAVGNLIDRMRYSYVVDAVDTVTAKIALVMKAKEAGVPIISSMGAGNKLNPFLFETADIYETSVCPLARVMRRELRKRGIRHLKVVYSKEEPLKPLKEADGPGSTAFVPSAAGLLIASEVIRDLTGDAVRKARAERE